MFSGSPVETQIMKAKDPLKQELLDYLKSRQESQSQYPNARGITCDDAFGTFE